MNELLSRCIGIFLMVCHLYILHLAGYIQSYIAMGLHNNWQAGVSQPIRHNGRFFWSGASSTAVGIDEICVESKNTAPSIVKDRIDWHCKGCHCHTFAS